MATRTTGEALQEKAGHWEAQLSPQELFVFLVGTLSGVVFKENMGNQKDNYNFAVPNFNTHTDPFGTGSFCQRGTAHDSLPLLWMDEIHCAPPKKPGMFPCKFQQTFGFQPWFPSGVNGFRPST